MKIRTSSRWIVLGLCVRRVSVDKECLLLCVLLGPESPLIYCRGDILESTHHWGCIHWSADGLVLVPESKGSSFYLRPNRRKGKRTLGMIRWLASSAQWSCPSYCENSFGFLCENKAHRFAGLVAFKCVAIMHWHVWSAVCCGATCQHAVSTVFLLTTKHWSLEVKRLKIVIKTYVWFYSYRCHLPANEFRYSYLDRVGM